jgi:hypothetical protein
MNKWGFLLLLFIVVSCTQQPEPLIAGIVWFIEWRKHKAA